MRSEARHAVRQGKLVPVLMDNVLPPKGLDEIQAIDLSDWTGSARDARVLDLVAAVRAKIAGEHSPPTEAASKRWKRRLAIGAALAAAAMTLVISADLGRVVSMACSVPIGQPLLSDACGSASIGNWPTRGERLAWETRDPASCEYLRTYLGSTPSGPYAQQATNLLQARQLVTSDEFVQFQRKLASYVRQPLEAMPSDELARAKALEDARADASLQTCRPALESERLSSVVIEPLRFDCRIANGGGHVCGLDFEVTCRMERQRVEERCG